MESYIVIKHDLEQAKLTMNFNDFNDKVIDFV